MIYLRAYARGNLGDDLFIKKVCEMYSDQTFYLLADKVYKKVFKDLKNLKIMSFSYKRLRKRRKNHEKWLKLNNKIIKRISKKCDTFLYVGGSIFIENNEIGLRAVKELKNEMSMFKKKYIVGANFGPYSSEGYLNYVHDELVPIVDHISFRDLDSYHLFKDIKNTSYAPDMIFSLENVSSNRKQNEVGISLIHHLERNVLKNNYDGYLNELVKISIKYIEKGYKIRFLSFCSYENDPLAVSDIMDKIPSKYRNDIVVDYYSNNIDSFLKIISGLEIIVATRFHSIVLGLKNNCEVIPICYSNKSINLLSDLGINQYVTFDNIGNLLNIKPYKISNHNLKKLEKESLGHFENLNFK